jgi:hypothetical protein
MMSKARSTAVWAAFIALAVIAVGCGGGSGSSSGSSSSGGPQSNSSSTSSTTASAAEGQSEGSKEFVGKGPNGKLAKVGKEASAAEKEAASQVLETSFTAREARDWKAQCKTLAALLVEQIEKTANSLGASPGCAKALEALTKTVPASALVNTMTGPISALRIKEGINGFAFWHGNDGKDYVIPLIKQSGWKLAAIKEEKAP